MIEYEYFDIDEKLVVAQEDEKIIYNKQEFYDFLDRCFLTDKIILKEEKEVIFFYNILSDEEKKIFGINEYFDCIDIAYNYYGLISDLEDQKISKQEVLDICHDWQKNYIEAIFSIDKKMKTSKSYYPRYLKYYNNKLNKKYLKTLKKIKIVNVFSISKQEKDLLNSLNIPITFYLYSNKADYDEENNILKNISYKKLKNVRAKSFKDNTTFLIYFTQYLKNIEKNKENVKILDISKDKKQYKQINEQIFNYKKNTKFNSSKIFSILSLYYEILKEPKLIYPIYKAVQNVNFKSFFEISEDEKLEIRKGMEVSLKYINTPLVTRLLEYNLEDIYTNLIKKYKDEAAIFVEALSEVQNIKEFENFDILRDERDELKLLIKYLQDKPFTSKISEAKYEISNNFYDVEKKHLIILNIQEDLLKKEKNFILSTIQKKKLGLKINLDYKYIEYYPYIRSIYEADKTDLFFIKNVENDIDIFSIFRDFIYKMELKVENIEYTPFEKINFFDKAFKPKKVKENGIFLTKRDGIKLGNEFQNININGYNFAEFMLSDIELYFNLILKRNHYTNFSTDEKSIGANIIGNIVHNIFQRAIEQNEFKNLEKIKDEVLENYRSYILKDYYKSYNILLFTDILVNIKRFFEKQKYELITSEVEMNYKYKNLNINFREDIFADNEIIDIKTGTKKFKISTILKYQLIAYRLFSELKGIKINKTYFYYPFSNDYEEEIENLTKEELDNRIKELISCRYINPDTNKKINYDLNNILRGSDYEL
jgi:hypothetical protein